MYKSVNDYLTQLQKELKGTDRAIVQDALSDAGEHLQTALASRGQSENEIDFLNQIIEKYGEPAEIAAAYSNIDIPQGAGKVAPEIQEKPPFREKPFSFLGVINDPAAWGAVLYMLISLITGIFYFTWVVTGVSLSAGLLVLIISIPLIGLFLLSVRGIALMEGRLVEALLRIRMPRRQIFLNSGRGLFRKLKALLASRLTWESLAYLILQFPLGIIYFTLSITLFAVSLGAIASPFLRLIFAQAVEWETNNQHLPDWWLPLIFVGGLLLFFLSLHLIRLIGKIHGKYAKIMLVQ
ncbi:MAG: sensor domain-containing protein [Candidatus Cloacimonetes bacterium]|nr:sensor domain-containing protein [Candidatus Cloacimonadota bacterium]